MLSSSVGFRSTFPPDAGSVWPRPSVLREPIAARGRGLVLIREISGLLKPFRERLRSLKPPQDPELSYPLLFHFPLQPIKAEAVRTVLGFCGEFGRHCRHFWMAALRRTLQVATLAAGTRRALAGSLAGSCLADRCLWDKLHAQPRPGRVPTFDWFFGYEEAQGLLLPLLQGAQAACPLRVLDVGCGTSSLSVGLYAKCPHPVDVLGVDFSPVAVAHMNKILEGGQGQTSLFPGHPASRLGFMQADAQNLEPVASGSFQLVLDKGTWDAVARGGLHGAYQLLSECLRVLSPQGTLIQFSDEDPDVRLPCLEQGSPGWSVTVQEMGPFKGITYFAYLVQGSHERRS